MPDTIYELQSIIQNRKDNPSDTSYTTTLFTAGEDEIIKKIGEEAVEVIIAAKSQGNQRVIEETADLVYHTLVLLINRGLTWEDINNELAKRKK